MLPKLSAIIVEYKLTLPESGGKLIEHLIDSAKDGTLGSTSFRSYPTFWRVAKRNGVTSGKQLLAMLKESP